MRRILALLLVGSGCETTTGRCVEEIWRVELPTAIHGEACEIEIASDGMVVVLTRGDAAALVEIAADGEIRDVSPLPAARDSVLTHTCWDLAIAPDGTRWATLHHQEGGDRSELRTYVALPGEPPRLHRFRSPTAADWLVGRLVADASNVYVAGSVRAHADALFDARVFAAQLDEDRAEIVPLLELSDLQSTYDLARSGDDRLYVVARPSGIDYADVHLVAFDLRRRDALWRRIVGSDATGADLWLRGALPFGDGDVVIPARELHSVSLSRYDRDGAQVWRTEQDQPPYRAELVATTTRSHIVSLLTRDTYSSNSASRESEIAVLDGDGRTECSASLAATDAPAELAAHPLDESIAIRWAGSSDGALSIALYELADP